MSAKDMWSIQVKKLIVYAVVRKRPTEGLEFRTERSNFFPVNCFYCPNCFFLLNCVTYLPGLGYECNSTKEEVTGDVQRRNDKQLKS